MTMRDPGLLLAVAALVAAASYHRQLWRRVTRVRGGPAQTTPWAPTLGVHGEPPDLHLAVVGDVGHPGPRLRAVGAALARLGDAQPFDGLVLLGDNVYPSGEPARLPETVFGPFGDVLARADLHAILGNHDVKAPPGRGARAERSHAAGQVAALGMPGRWWAARLPGDVLLIRSHGTTPQVRAEAAERGLEIVGPVSSNTSERSQTQASWPSCAATREMSRSRVGSAIALSAPARVSAWSAVMTSPVTGAQHAARESGSRSGRAVGTCS